MGCASSAPASIPPAGASAHSFRGCWSACGSELRLWVWRLVAKSKSKRRAAGLFIGKVLFGIVIKADISCWSFVGVYVASAMPVPPPTTSPGLDGVAVEGGCKKPALVIVCPVKGAGGCRTVPRAGPVVGGVRPAKHHENMHRSPPPSAHRPPAPGPPPSGNSELLPCKTAADGKGPCRSSFFAAGYR